MCGEKRRISALILLIIRAKENQKKHLNAFDVLWHEAEEHPAMMSVGLHPRLIGRPGRISGLTTFWEHN